MSNAVPTITLRHLEEFDGRHISDLEKCKEKLTSLFKKFPEFSHEVKQRGDQAHGLVVNGYITLPISELKRFFEEEEANKLQFKTEEPVATLVTYYTS